MAVRSRSVKVAAVIIAGLAIILVGFLFTLKAVDWSEHQELVVEVLEAYTDWNVQRLGDIQVELFFPTRIRIDQIELTQEIPTATVSSVSAEHFEIRFSPLSAIFQDRLHIYDIKTSGASIVARQTEPAEAPKGRISIPFIESMKIENTDIVYQNTEDLNAHIAQLNLSSQGKREPLTIAGQGTLADLPVEIEGTLGALNKLDNARTSYPIELGALVAGDSIALKGHLTPNDRSGAFELDVNVDAQGDHLPCIAQTFGVSLRSAPPYKLRFSAQGPTERIDVRNIQATLGHSYVYGSATLQLNQPKPYLRADLGASMLRLKDISELIPEAKEAPRPTPYIFSRQTMDLSALHSLNARVELALGEYKGKNLGDLISGLKAEAQLDNGKLTITFNELSLAEGTLAGSASLNDRSAPTEASLELSAKRTDLTELVAPYFTDVDRQGTKPSEIVRGTMAATVDLRASGNTPHALASHVNGKFSFAVEDGAVTATLVEALGLDITEIASTWLADTPLTDIRCALGIFNADSGVIKTKVLLLSTRDSNIIGRGSIDLEKETVDFTLEAHAKDFSLPATQSPIHITGPLTNVKIDVVSGELVAKLGGAALLTLVQPVLAVAPLLATGLTGRGRCSDLQSELQHIQRKARSQQDKRS